MSVRHQITIDHIEGDVAVVVVDGGASLDLPLWMLPASAREGDVMTVEVEHTATGSSAVTLTRDEEAGRAARREIAARLDRLAERDDGSDLAL